MRRIRLIAVLLSALAPGLLNAAPPEEKFELTAEEKAVLEATNRERAKENLPPLKLIPALARVARAHAANMARQGKMEHVLDGKQPHERVKEAGHRAAWVGENIAYGTGLTGKAAVELWMGSEGHRKNILDEKYTEIGIGTARTSDGSVYYTQVFARP